MSALRIYRVLVAVLFALGLVYVSQRSSDEPAEISLSWSRTVGAAQPVASGGELRLPCEIVSVHDGDTVRVRISIEMPIRLRDCWAAELKEPAGPAARDNLLKLIPVGSKQQLSVTIMPDVSDMLTFGRVLGDISNERGSVASQQVSGGFATTTKVKTK